MGKRIDKVREVTVLAYAIILLIREGVFLYRTLDGVIRSVAFKLALRRVTSDYETGCQECHDTQSQADTLADANGDGPGSGTGLVAESGATDSARNKRRQTSTENGRREPS